LPPEAPTKPAVQKNCPLGAYPRIGVLFKTEAFWENKHRHIVNIGVYAYLRALFSQNNEEFGQVSVDSERAFSDRLLEGEWEFLIVLDTGRW